MALGLFIILGSFAALADANTFLGKVRQNDAMGGLSAEAEQALLDELENALGSNHRHATERRLKRMEQMLKPMFGAVSKNENGKLSAPAAGYILHRVFIQRHGWFIRALEPAGGAVAAWNSSTPVSVLEERVPQNVTDLFEKRLGERGLGLREIAILAATLEHLVHNEALERLDVAFRVKELSKEDALSEEEAISVLDMYMTVYIIGFAAKDLANVSPKHAKTWEDGIIEVYPTWPDTQTFLREVYHSVAPKRDYLYFNEVENVIAEVGERYGRWQDSECRALKDWLVAKEDSSVGGAGRVRLSDFYGMALNEKRWQFSESIEYLRSLGALDEVDASNPRVIIPNYLSSPSNCVASSSYYSVCCIDECESIFGRLEELTSAPAAAPATITSLVKMIPSATMPSNRTLSPWLHQRLDEVAKHHGGVVPLHGRLFLQWMHYAYPRECPFPHMAGSIDPVRPEDILKANNNTVSAISANETVMKEAVAAAVPGKQRVPGSESNAEDESAMWSMHEELVVHRESFAIQEERSFGLREVGFVGAVLSLSVALVRNLETGMKSGAFTKFSEKHYV